MAEPAPRDRAQDGIVELRIRRLALLPHAARELDGARRDGVHADLLRRQHERLRHGVVDQRRLDGRVRGGAPAGAIAGDRGDVEDRTATRLFEEWNGGVRGAHGGHDVDIEAFGPSGLVVGLPEAGRVVDQDVDAAQRIRRRGDVGGDGALVGQVADGGVCLGAELGDLGRCLVQAGLPACADGNGRAGAGKAQRDRSADALAAAGDDHTFPTQLEVHARTPLLWAAPRGAFLVAACPRSWPARGSLRRLPRRRAAGRPVRCRYSGR